MSGASVGSTIPVPLDARDRGGAQQPMLIAQDLRKYFPIRGGLLQRHLADVKAVDQVSFSVRKGETLGVVGESGCGKSTLARLLMRLIEPDAGEMIFDGDPVGGMRGMNLRDLRRNMQMVFQDSSSSLNPRMPVRDSIAYGPMAHGMKGTAARALGADLLEKVGLRAATFGSRYPHELSGGQKQRVAIARALAVEPQVLLLDEPLSALDLRLRQHMRAELRAIQKRVGITFIYITHDQGEALTMSDRVAVMNHGVVEQVGDGRGVYDDPATPFVASFVGENNGFEGTVASVEGGFARVETPVGRLTGRVREGLREGDKAILFIRPEAIRIADAGSIPGLTALVTGSAFEGNVTHIALRCADGRAATMTLGRNAGAHTLHVGDPVGVDFAPSEAIVMPLQTRA